MSYLKIENLNKVYQLHNNECIALKDINLEFNNRGLVFVVGKSGSGKSTLLNVIGGIDSLTSGSIILKNRDYNDFTINDFDYLRKNEVGFVFQDFCLIDNLTVLGNITISSIAKDNIANEELANDLIKKVGLTGYENKLCKQLSAGQRQRVAIARAMVKKPEILLCDEPTGNLDYSTSKVVLDLLKEISKNILVIVVSHNLDDAYSYADRIIKLKNGEVEHDLENRHNYQSNVVVDDTLYMSSMRTLNDEELDKINEGIQSGKITNIQRKRRLFVDKPAIDNQNEFDIHPHTSLTLKNRFQLTNKLLRKQFDKIVLFAFAIALMIAIVAVSFMFIHYDRTTAIKQIVNQTDTTGEIFSHFPVSYNEAILISDEEMNDFYSLNYGGEVNKLVNVQSFYSRANYVEKDLFTTYGQSLSFAAYKNIISTNLHLVISSGTLVTNEDYIKKVFGFTDEIHYKAILPEEERKPYGIYITDFEVDEYGAYVNKTYNYESLLGQYKKEDPDLTYNTYYINGIIDTNYKETFKNELQVLQEARNDSSKKTKLQYNQDVLNYLFVVTHYYMIGYTTNPNFVSDYINNLPRQLLYMSGFDLSTNIENEEVIILSATDNANNITKNAFYLNNLIDETNTVYIPYKSLNEATGKSLSVTQWNELLKSTICHFTFKDFNDNILYDLPYELKATSSSKLMLSQNVFKELLSIRIKPLRIYLNNNYDLKPAYIALSEKNYNVITANTDYANKVAMGVEVYSDFFKITFVIALLAVIIIILFASFNGVSRFKYEIGVLKSLGVTNGEIFSIFNIQLIYLILSTIILSIVAIFIATSLSNQVLISAFNNLYHISLYNIKILFVSGSLVKFLLTIVLSTSIISTIIPLIVLRFMKPINIIKARY